MRAIVCLFFSILPVFPFSISPFAFYNLNPEKTAPGVSPDAVSLIFISLYIVYWTQYPAALNL